MVSLLREEQVIELVGLLQVLCGGVVVSNVAYQIDCFAAAVVSGEESVPRRSTVSSKRGVVHSLAVAVEVRRCGLVQARGQRGVDVVHQSVNIFHRRIFKTEIAFPIEDGHKRVHVLLYLRQNDYTHYLSAKNL